MLAQPLAQAVTTPIGIPVNLLKRLTNGLQGRRRGTQGILVGGKLEHFIKAELPLHLFHRFSRAVRDQPKNLRPCQLLKRFTASFHHSFFPNDNITPAAKHHPEATPPVISILQLLARSGSLGYDPKTFRKRHSSRSPSSAAFTRVSSS